MRLLVAAIAAFALSAPAAHAITWAEIPSNTTAEITAIEYQSSTRFWYTTANGDIFKRKPDGTFERTRTGGAVRLTDIEFQDGGDVGIAVGDNGLVLRSQDGGTTWAPVTGIPVSALEASGAFPNCKVQEALGNVYSVRFAGSSKAWIMAEGSQLARTTAGATATNVGQTGGWEDANWVDETPAGRSPEDTCRLQQAYNEGIADAFFVPSNPDVAYFVGGAFAGVYFTTNGLTSSGVEKPAGAGNAGGGARVIAGDPDNPQRAWSVNPAPYGKSTAHYTEDGYATAQTFELANSTREFTQNGPYDVDFKGGTVIAVGDGGMILSSIDGRNFYFVDAALTQDWRAVGVADATNAAVGGKAGKLIISTTANITPDTTKPTGTISGPATGKTGEALTFTATLADEAGGSGVNAGASRWTTPGLPDQTGNQVSFTFPNPGTYVIALTFADNAGNTNQASATVTVTGEPGGSLPTPVLPGSTSPPLVGGAATKKGKYIILKVKGRLGLPAGLTAAEACNGTMSISVYKGKKRLVGKTTKVKKNCGYKKTIKVKRKKVGKAKKLKLKVAFRGNSKMGKLSSTYKVSVKKK